MNGPDDLKEVDSKEEDPKETNHVALDNTAWRKLDMWILPLCTAFFLIANLDRRNIANARVAGLQASLKMSNNQFSMALTASNVPAIASQFPAALLMKRVGFNIMIPTMVTLWGLLSIAQGFVSNYVGLLACRCLLGLVEGGVFPGLILYLSSFYPPQMLQTRIAAFFSLTLLSAAFSGLLAAAIEQMHGVGGKPGWAWIFILEGIITFLFGVISFFIFPCSPDKIPSLTKEERIYIISALKHTNQLSEDDRFSWAEVVQTAKSPHVWLLTVIFFFSGTILFGIAYFEPSIVAGLGYKRDQAQLMSAPPFVVTSVAALASGIIADRYQCRGYTVIFFSIWKMIGFTMFYVSKSNLVRYVSLFFSVTGVSCAAPAMITWLANNSAPHTRRATAVALTMILTQLGAVCAPWLFGSLSPPPNYTPAIISFIVMSAATVLFSMANLVYLRRENRLKAEKRQWMHKEDEPQGLGDRSAWFVYCL